MGKAETSEAKMSITETSKDGTSKTELSEAKLGKAKTSEAKMSKVETSEAKMSKTETSKDGTSKTETSEAKMGKPKTNEAKMSKVETTEAKMSKTETSKDGASKPDTSEENKDYFNSLPDEVIVMIFSYVSDGMRSRSTCELARLELVCKRWRQLVRDESLWEDVDISCVNITLPILASLIQRGVYFLTMQSTKIEDPDPWKSCFPKNYKSNLQGLDMKLARLSKRGCVHLLQQCENLRHLEAWNADLCRQSCEAIAKNSQLNYLNLFGAHGLDAHGITAILKGCSELEELVLDQTMLSKHALDALFSNLNPSLQRLGLWGVSDYLRDEHVFQLVEKCPNLRHLNLMGNFDLTNAAYERAETLKDLEDLVDDRSIFSFGEEDEEDDDVLSDDDVFHSNSDDDEGGQGSASEDENSSDEEPGSYIDSDEDDGEECPSGGSEDAGSNHSNDRDDEEAVGGNDSERGEEE